MLVGAAAGDDGAVVDATVWGVDVVRPAACAEGAEVALPGPLPVVDAPEPPGTEPAGLAPEATAIVDDGDGVPGEADPADVPAPEADDPAADDELPPGPVAVGAVACRRTWPGRAADTTPASQATAAVDPMVATDVTRRSRARPCARRVTPSGMPVPPTAPRSLSPHLGTSSPK